MLTIILLHALWGSSIPMSKFLLTLTSPVWLTGLRMSLAGLVLLFYNGIKQTNLTFKKEHLWFYFQIIFFGVYLKYILRNFGLSYMSSTKMSFLLNITPFLAALFSYIAFRETLTKKQFLGLIIGFLGIVPILLIASPIEQLMGELFLISLPECAILFAISCHTYSIIVMRKMVRENNYSAAMTNSIRMLGGGFLAIITAPILEGGLVISKPIEFAWWLALVIFISNVVCHNLYIHLLKYYSATFISLTDFLSPIFTAFYGWLFLHEIISWHYYLSTILVFVGLLLFYQEELAKNNIDNKKLLQAVLPKRLSQLVYR